MKTFKNLYGRVGDFPNLLKSYRQARKNKSGRDYVIGFEWEVEKNLLRIKEELENQTCEFGRYKRFCVFDPKKRLISAAPFRDRIVHQVIYSPIERSSDRRNTKIVSLKNIYSTAPPFFYSTI